VPAGKSLTLLRGRRRKEIRDRELEQLREQYDAEEKDERPFRLT
jgi:hypothetical protein